MINDLKNKTPEQLQSNYVMLKAITVALAIVVSLLVGISVYGLITKDNNSTFIPLIAVGVSCSAMIPLQLISMKKIKKEMKLRE